jgi:hypothetical protein
MKYKYNIAISFVEEDRNAALALALALEIKGCKKVYYYPDNLDETSGEILLNILSEIYAKRARYAVILLSANYFKKVKGLVGIELQSIEQRMTKESGIAYAIPVKLERELSLENYTFLNQLAFLEWNYNPRKIATILLKRLGKRTSKREKLISESLTLIQKNNNQNGTVGTQKNTVVFRS